MALTLYPQQLALMFSPVINCVKKHYRKMFVVLATLLVAINCVYWFLDYRSVKIHRLTDLTHFPISDKLKDYMLHQHEARLALIQYDGKTISVYVNDPEHYTTEVTPVLTHLKTFAQSKNYTLLKGLYLLAMDDGVHTKLCITGLNFCQYSR